MKKFMYRMAAIAALFTCVLTLSSCGSDDDNNASVDSNIVGTWNIFETSSSQVVFGQTVFNSNGTFSTVAYNIYGENLVEGTTINEDNIESVERLTTSGNFTAKNGIITDTMNGYSRSGSYSIKNTTLEGKTVKQLTITDSDGVETYYMSSELQQRFKEIEEEYVNQK